MQHLKSNLKVNEIFYSIQGESTHAGKPCVFIRLTYCNLRCSYCDTEYAFHTGRDMSVDEIIRTIQKYPCRLVEVTGGEPLVQENTVRLMEELIRNGYNVLLETGGSLPVADVPKDVIKIVDFKCPSSGMKKKNLWSIIQDLNPQDEIKFVIGNREDFDWAKERVTMHKLTENYTVLFSPVFGELQYRTLAGWILETGLPIRFQAQLHKHIWSPGKRGV